MTAVQFLEMFVSVSIQAAIYVVLCAWISSRTSSDRSRSQLWAYCQFGLLGLVMLACSLPHFRIVHGRELSTPEKILEAVNLQTWLGEFLFVVWGIGFLMAMTRVLISGIRLVRFLRTLRSLDSTRLPLPPLADELPKISHVRFFVSDSLAGPFCWQFQRPVMVLPTAFLDFESRELQLILKHELAHLKADHPLQLFIQQVVQCVFWFHPVVIWGGRQTDIARELMCDAAAAEDRQEIADYLRVLLRVMERTPDVRQTPVGLGLIFQRDPSAIALRARRLTARAKSATTLSRGWDWFPWCSLLLVGVVTALWLPVNALSSPRSNWSACPAWTAEVLHDFGINARDYEVYDGRLQIFDRDENQSGECD